MQLQGEVSTEYRALNGIFEKHGLLKKPIDLLSSESADSILNGTGFSLTGCDTFRFFFYHGWRAINRTDKGYYYCSKDYVLTVHVTWYFSRVSVSKEFVRELNRKWVLFLHVEWFQPRFGLVRGDIYCNGRECFRNLSFRWKIFPLYRSRWLIESPQKYVKEYRLPQIPSWYRVHDTPLTEEKADPIALHDVLGSVFIYFSGLALGCAFLIFEFIVKGLMMTICNNLNKRDKSRTTRARLNFFNETNFPSRSHESPARI